ncbi:MAG: bifunctional phosphopantothenoylcysteine decarboxylase/phosphopantothenate--cysteine ligase CoaBC [Bifidobacteriaceae bacterium]|jgi:phosphopantothenoylcysteine decarboxylase/phosphopantothenate--cysteine ligase|nr:bifunctional phosphopantothenoylcysteine decarboxylase/phosphopantothenate--cysteine ligase CoaBC [Bifidobacteriaceae bacterium]
MIVVGVTGGIAAYKAPALVRLLTEGGHRVRVVPTEAALRFVGAATLEALTGAPAVSGVFEQAANVDHIALAAQARAVVVAPATADFLARYASGLANDLLTTTLLATRAPVAVAPAMHTAMLEHPATRANLATLRDRGVVVLDSPSGRLTGADSGPGRMLEPEAIAAAVERLLRPPDLVGRKVLVSAGGTREPLDPVRFLGNRSSGKQGVAIAAAAAQRGAEVTLVAANVEVPPPWGAEVVSVGTALELDVAMRERAGVADLIVMAAAVADFRPAEPIGTKIKRDGRQGMTIDLVPNPDILVRLVGSRPPGQVIVGFAAETGDSTASALEQAAAKSKRKGTDLTVANVVTGGAVFGEDANAVVFLSSEGERLGEAAGTKRDVAEAILDLVQPWLVGAPR